jgi:hypothetical protein
VHVPARTERALPGRCRQEGGRARAHEGEVVIEYKGVALASRQFVKDARVCQGAIADNKILGPLLAQIRQQQEERDAQVLATKRLTLRDEDLMRKNMGQARLPTRRKRVACRA